MTKHKPGDARETYRRVSPVAAYICAVSRFDNPLRNGDAHALLVTPCARFGDYTREDSASRYDKAATLDPARQDSMIFAHEYLLTRIAIGFYAKASTRSDAAAAESGGSGGVYVHLSA